jgi:cytochrome c553
VPRPGPQGTRAIAEHRRPFAELHVSPALRLQAWRAGREWSPLMVQVVSNLDQEDMLAIVAYLASLDP